MEASTTTIRSRLPAVRLDAQGRRQIDWRAVFALVLPLFVNNSVQSVLSLTDLWFVGRISTTATAALGAIYYLTILVMVFFGGLGMAVQTLVSQAFGGGRGVRASLATWAGLWGALCTAPFFAALALVGAQVLAPFNLDPEIQRHALDYWFPRVLCGPLNVALWAIGGYFNGVGRERVTLVVMLCAGGLNIPLNELFIFTFNGGMAGAAWATAVSQAMGLLIGIGLFLNRRSRVGFKSHLVWRPRLNQLWRLISLGVPMGLAIAVDLAGFALFMLLQSMLAGVGATATPIVMQLTSVAFAPAIGIALAGTTLVGQCIGAGDKEWAVRCGNAIVKMCVLYMGSVGLLLAVTGPWVAPAFVRPDDPAAASIVAMASQLLWIAAAYQIFDATNLSTSFCLRGAGDVKVPAVMLVVCSWGVFIPLCHILTFAPGQGLVRFLPQLGWGSPGGWTAAVVYVVLLSFCLFTRWVSGRWKKIRVL